MICKDQKINKGIQKLTFKFLRKILELDKLIIRLF